VEAIKQMVVIPENHRIVLEVPEYIESNQIAEIVMIFKGKRSKRKEKIKDLSLAMKDIMFLNDMKKIENDFENIDNEGW